MEPRSTSRRKRDPLQELERDATERVVDLKIVFVRDKTGERIFEVGGRFDCTDGCFLDEQPRSCKVLRLSEAQLESALALFMWITFRIAGSKRVVEILLDGARGSGKSILGVWIVWAVAIALPGARCFLVSTANTRRGELERIVKDHIPRSWRRGWSGKDYTYTLPNGSTIQYIGADDEDALRQGGYEIALLNEMQLFTSSAYATLAAGVRNLSGRPKGLLVGAMNYATKVRGEWTEDHLDKIDAQQINAVHFKLDPRLNQFIDSDVVDDVDGLIRSARPDLADADAKGIRRRLTDLAAPAFRAWPTNVRAKNADGELVLGHVGGPTDIGYRDVTREITFKKLGKAYPVVVAADFQKRPGCCAIFLRMYERAVDKRIVYHAFKFIGADDNEDDLGSRIDSFAATLGLEAREVFIVADGSGKWQNTDRNTLTKKSIEILREWHFHVEPVVPPVDPRNTSGAGRNPDVQDNLAQLYDACEADRLLVAPSETWIVDCLRRCKIKKRGFSVCLDDRKPGYSHAVDCVRYTIHFFDPKRGVPRPAPSMSGPKHFQARRV